MNYYIENPSHEYQIDYIVIDCIVNEKRKIYSKEERESYLSSLLLSPPLDIKLSPDVLRSFWELDAQLVIQSIERQTSDMRCQLQQLKMQAGKHSAKIALQINEMKLQLEMQAMECSKLLVEEPHGSTVVDNGISRVNFNEVEVVIEDDKVEFPSMPSSGHTIVDFFKYDGLDAYMEALKSTPRSEPLALHGIPMQEVKKEACHFQVKETTMIYLPRSPCFKPWDPGGSSYVFTITSLFFSKLWDPGGRSHVGSTPWSLYHKLWDPGG